MAGAVIKTDVDVGDLFKRTLTALEQRELPYVLQQAVNRTADDMKQTWERVIPVVFDRPSRLTRNAVFVKKARYSRSSNGRKVSEAAIVMIKDQVGKGTAPAQYLMPQVQGGPRRQKGLEAALGRLGILLGNERAVPAAGAPLDAFGNIRQGIIPQILSQLGANREVGSLSNETTASRARNARRGARVQSLKSQNRRYFVVRGVGKNGYVTNKDGSTRASHLASGIYQRLGGRKNGRLRSIFTFVRSANYRKRFDIFGLAQKIYNRRFPFYFEREMAKALENARLRGRA